MHSIIYTQEQLFEVKVEDPWKGYGGSLEGVYLFKTLNILEEYFGKFYGYLEDTIFQKLCYLDEDFASNQTRTIPKNEDNLMDRGQEISEFLEDEFCQIYSSLETESESSKKSRKTLSKADQFALERRELFEFLENKNTNEQARLLNLWGLPTQRGKQWRAQGVMNIQKRLKQIIQDLS